MKSKQKEMKIRVNGKRKREKECKMGKIGKRMKYNEDC